MALPHTPESALRNCPKSLGGAPSVAQRAAKEGFSVHFVLRIVAKSSLGPLLVPFSDSLSRQYGE